MKTKFSLSLGSLSLAWTILLVSFLPAIGSSAQDCTAASLLQKPGTWKEGMKGSTTGIPADVLLKEKSVIAAIHGLLKQAYSPKGLEVVFTGAYDRLTPDMPVGQYYYGLYLMPYSCVGNIAKPDGETNTTVFIKANDPEIPFSREVIADDLDESDKAHFGWLKRMPVQRDGAWFLGEQEQSSGMGVQVKHLQWLITSDQKLPFQYVTRKEYLEKSIGLLQKVKERELKKIETEYAADPKNRDRMYAGMKKYYEDKSAAVEKAAQGQSPEDLRQAAIVPTGGDFAGFLNEGERFAVILVKENPDYFNSKLSKGIPQLFSIVFEYDFRQPVLAQAYAEVMKALDFAALKNMLGR